jgi:hypothetical protein
MPFKSKAQQRLFFAKENRGELPKGTAMEWAHKTENIKALPEHTKKSASEIADMVLAKSAASFAPAALSARFLAKKRKATKKTASELADRALATSKSLRDFYEGGKWAPGGVEYQGSFKLATDVATNEKAPVPLAMTTRVGVVSKTKKTASEIAVEVLRRMGQ